MLWSDFERNGEHTIIPLSIYLIAWQRVQMLCMHTHIHEIDLARSHVPHIQLIFRDYNFFSSYSLTLFALVLSFSSIRIFFGNIVGIGNRPTKIYTAYMQYKKYTSECCAHHRMSRCERQMDVTALILDCRYLSDDQCNFFFLHSHSVPIPYTLWPRTIANDKFAPELRHAKRNAIQTEKRQECVCVCLCADMRQL